MAGGNSPMQPYMFPSDETPIEIDAEAVGEAVDEELRETPILVTIANVSAAPLTKGNTVSEEVTCTLANTDYVMATAMAEGTKYLAISCTDDCLVAMGAVTSSTNGILIIGGAPPVYFPVNVTDVEADNKAHVQSSTAGAVARFTSMRD